MLQDKVAIVTGGSKGIGEAIVRELAKNGAKVIFTYLSSEDSALKLRMISLLIVDLPKL